MKLISAAQYEEMDKTKVAGHVVTKEDFFRLTSLATMTDEGAAEATYQRWVLSKRVVEVTEKKEDPTGLVPDEVKVFIECRFVNAERRRENNNKRAIEASRAQAQELLPAALRTP